MRRIYNLKLIYDYINGNDIDGYNLEDLENDSDFMLQVLDVTKDKRMYELCSDDIKCDYKFVRRVINIFKDDIQFISNVANRYLDSLTDAEREHGVSYNELNIIMSNLCGKTLNNFSIRTAMFYEYERQRIKACIGAFEDVAMREESKEGFIITAVEYEESPIIIDFVARRMINDVFYGKQYNNLEYLIHSRFKSIEEFENYGVVHFLQDCVGNFDQSLCSYVFDSNRPNMIEMFFGQVLKEVKNVERKWPMYMDSVNSWRVNLFQYSMSKFMFDNDYVGDLSYEDIASYVAKRIGVSDVFKRFDPWFPQKYDENKYKILDTSDVVCLTRGVALANKLFSVDVINSGYEHYDEKSEVDRKNVIKFKLIDS